MKYNRSFLWSLIFSDNKLLKLTLVKWFYYGWIILFYLHNNTLNLISNKNKKQNYLTGLPLLIFANKQDLNLTLNPEEIMDTLNLNNIKDRKWTIIACSAITKLGLLEGIQWLTESVK